MTDETAMVIKIASGIVGTLVLAISILFAYIKRQHAKEIKALKEHSKEIVDLHKGTTTVITSIQTVIEKTNVISAGQTDLLKEVKGLLMQKRTR